MRVIAFGHAGDDPATRFRIGQYIPHLQQAGWDVSLRTNHPPRPWVSHTWLERRIGVIQRRLRRDRDIRAASEYDAVWLNRDLLEGRVEYEERLVRRNPRLLFDFDDAIFLGEKSRHIQWICQHAAWVTAGNDYLASFARRFTDRVTVLPTVIDTDLYRVATEAGSPVRVGWLGSDRSIRETLFPHLPMLSSLQAELGFDFVIVSQPKPELPPCGLRYRFEPWSPQAETSIADLFDIGIMPLIDDEFQRGKCGCKLLQYMAAGLPSIASPVGINSSLLDRGRCGFLADSPQDWRQGLAALISDADARRELGANGRSFVEQEYSVRRWLPELVGILENVSTSHQRRSASGEPEPSGPRSSPDPQETPHARPAR